MENLGDNDGGRASVSSGKTVVAEGFGANPDQGEMDVFLSRFNHSALEEITKSVEHESNPTYKRTTRFAFMDITPFLRNGIESVVKDSFTQCFVSKRRVPWNNMFYLWPLYFAGVLVRYCILFPIRLVIVILALVFFGLVLAVSSVCKAPRRKAMQDMGCRFLANAFLASWCAVVMEHGVIPPREKGQIFVSNHTSVIDVVLLLHRQKYSLTGQMQSGLIGFFQNVVLASMDNLWFDRLESKDRHLVAQKIKEHCNDLSKPPLLVFPEGTCVNNEYVVMFKRGAFELGGCIVPVAIKYNKIFVDAFWNSKAQSFPMHLFALMTSWAVVCDVWYMEPQYKQEGETSNAFAARVKEMIANQARLESVPWDGYLKYFKPKAEFKVQRQEVYAKSLVRRFGGREELAEDTAKWLASQPSSPKRPGSPGKEGAGPRTPFHASKD